VRKVDTLGYSGQSALQAVRDSAIGKGSLLRADIKRAKQRITGNLDF
jgi:hypothetical protein